MGLISELFRRQKGTLRSVHATHPVLARGARAAQMLAGHENAASPCGAGSPFARLLEANGKILLLGTSIETMTFFHYLEEEFEPRLAVSPLTSEFFTAEVRAEGKPVQVRTRLFEPSLSRRRRIDVMLPELRRLNGISAARAGVVPITLIEAAAARRAFESILNKGLSFYE
jgi:aminoglycoside 3-N-acetyltransferase